MSLTPAGFDYRECEVASGHAIQLARENKGLTQAALAARIGADEKFMADIETGEKSADLTTLAELATSGLQIRFGELGHFIDQYLGRT